MSNKTDSQKFLTELEPVRQQVEQWRSNRKHQRERIPGELWEAMASLARAHGLNRVCRALRVDYYGLKRRMGQAPPASPAFVEVFPPIGAHAAGDVIEVEDRQGRRMTLRLSVHHRADTLGLIQSFWKEA